MAELQHLTNAFRPELPEADLPTKDAEYNLMIDWQCQAEKSGVKQTLSIASPLLSLLKEDLVGCGPVTLVKLVIKYQFTAKLQSVYFGTYLADAAFTAEQAAGRPGGHRARSTDYNYGSDEEFEVKIPDLYSKQIQPPDNRAPNFCFYLKASASVEVNLHFYLKIHGPRTISVVKAF